MREVGECVEGGREGGRGRWRNCLPPPPMGGAAVLLSFWVVLLLSSLEPCFAVPNSFWVVVLVAMVPLLQVVDASRCGGGKKKLHQINLKFV